MSFVQLRSSDQCRWDLVALGEVMLRLDPGDGRVYTARTFRACEGGGEYNVARALRRCFGQRTTIVTALADNPVGRLVEDFIRQGGVDQSHVRWVPYDGVGRTVRNGLNFTERGFGVRGALSCSDRGNTAASQISVGTIDWEYIFGREGARWFHTGGIFAGLSSSTAEVALEAMKVANRAGTVISYDLNYRSSLWQGVGGVARAQEVNRALVRNAHILFGNEEDFPLALGFELDGVGEDYTNLDPSTYEVLLGRVAEAFPNLHAIGVTLRSVRSATVNDWSGLCFADGQIYKARGRSDLEIFDRVGGGDGFAAGFVFAILDGGDLDQAVEYGTALGALAMTTPGDTADVTREEVERLVANRSARVLR